MKNIIWKAKHIYWCCKRLANGENIMVNNQGKKNFQVSIEHKSKNYSSMVCTHPWFIGSNAAIFFITKIKKKKCLLVIWINRCKYIRCKINMNIYMYICLRKIYTGRTTIGQLSMIATVMHSLLNIYMFQLEELIQQDCMCVKKWKQSKNFTQAYQNVIFYFQLYIFYKLTCFLLI